MATASELLARAARTTELLTVDMDTRVISIPTTVRVLGVESDDDVRRLWFNVPRHYGEFDLSKFDIRINFKHEKGDGDFYPVSRDEIDVNDDTMTFSWLVDRTAYKSKGEVSFSICMKLYDQTGVVIKELNTTPASLPVLEGLETEKAIVENNPSAFDSILYRLYAVETATGNGSNGYYTIAKVEDTTDGVVVTIMGNDGKTEAVIRHGKDGEDGSTPERGVHYWTEADQEEIKSEINTASTDYINSWAPVNMSVILESGDDNWVDNKQTVIVPGVNSTNLVIVAPDSPDANYNEYARCGVRCIVQELNKLTFECKFKPVIDLTVNVAVYYTTESIATGGSFNVTHDGNGNVTIY